MKSNYICIERLVFKVALVKVDDLADAIAEELKAYSEEVTEQVKEDVKQVAKECCQAIKKNPPEDSGEYKSGWKTKVVYENQHDIRVQVYNTKKPQLTHLLEHGHAKLNGGRVEGKAHIRPAEQQAEKSLVGKVKVAVR